MLSQPCVLMYVAVPLQAALQLYPPRDHQSAHPLLQLLQAHWATSALESVHRKKQSQPCWCTLLCLCRQFFHAAAGPCSPGECQPAHHLPELLQGHNAASALGIIQPQATRRDFSHAVVLAQGRQRLCQCFSRLPCGLCFTPLCTWTDMRIICKSAEAKSCVICARSSHTKPVAVHLHAVSFSASAPACEAAF